MSFLAYNVQLLVMMVRRGSGHQQVTSSSRPVHGGQLTTLLLCGLGVAPIYLESVDGCLGQRCHTVWSSSNSVVSMNKYICQVCDAPEEMNANKVIENVNG